MNQVAPLPTDEYLCEATRRGDRDAFDTLVQRYQTLLCSIAFSRTGNLAASQDLAQDAFLTAWSRINELRDPSLLRSWLCGILRNLAASSIRKDRRRGETALIPENARSKDEDPEALAVSREEESLLWGALEGMPEQYREPLVLYYREEQSISGVAQQLDLSEDAVKQRLSRGRAKLRGQMEQIVESALKRSKPKAAFTSSVLAAIAFSSPGNASAAAIVTSAACIGLGTAASVAVVTGPAAGLSIAWLSAFAVGNNARSPAERRIIHAGFRQAIFFCVPMILLLLAIISAGLSIFRAQPWFLIIGVSLWTCTLLAYLLRAGRLLQQEIAGHRGVPEASRRYQSTTSWLGLPLYAFASVGLDPGAPPQRSALAWVAVGDLAISPFLAIGGIAIAPIAIGGITVGILSISIAGVALGIFAVGSLAMGWCAFGMAAVGWKAAAGAAVVAIDYAWGGIAQAAEANTPAAKAWFVNQWFTVPVEIYATSIPWLIGLAVIAPLGYLFWQAAKTVELPENSSIGRLHGLDALRAAALLSGIVLHSTLNYLLPPGMWAVGTREPQLFLGWLVYYLHSFRLELFFLLAGYFGSLVIKRRGTIAYVRDRAIRILLVFALALYPMKFTLHSLWIVGGHHTGRLKSQSGTAAKPWYELATASITSETWPNIGLTHLWFLYVLACLTAMFLAVRALAGQLGNPEPVSRVLRSAVGSRQFSWLLALVTTGLLAQMKGMDIDTPDRSFVWNWPVMALYAIFFSLGWWLQARPDLVDSFRSRHKSYLILGLVASSLASAGIGMRYTGGDWATAHGSALRWATSFGTALTMSASVFGWLGAFLEWFQHPSKIARRLADASYFIYIAHLPVVVAMQIALAGFRLPWWIQIPVVNAATIAILLVGYEWAIRSTWIGRWLNGAKGHPRR